MADKADRTLQTDEIMFYLFRHMVTTPNARRTKESLDNYSDHLVSRIHKVCLRKSVDVMTLRFLIADQIPEHLLSQNVFFMPNLSRGAGFTGYSSAPIINALHRYEGLPRHDDYSKANAVTRKQCLALIRVTNALLDYADIKNTPIVRNNETSEHWISDERLARLIMDNHARAGRIIKSISESRRGDYGYIEAVLAGKNVTLTDGML